MQIDRIKDDAALRRTQPNISNMLAGKIAPAQYHSIELRAICDEIVAHFFNVGVINNFDPAFLELAGIQRNVGQIIWNESHAMAKLVEEFEDLEHPQRS